MLIIPAIDLKDGKCVRLRQGRLDDETVYGDDPVRMADHWAGQGARRLHIVDLDGAKTGKPQHFDTICAIAKNHPDLPIQVGGGIRTGDDVQAYLDADIQYVVLGTRALSQPHLVKDLCLEYPEHIIVGLDIKDGRLASAAWSKLSHHDLYELAEHFEKDGAAAIVHTDIQSDGMMTGLNLEATKKLAERISTPVIAAGGLRDLKDVEALCALKDSGLIGAVTGRAIYEKKLDLAAAQKLADKLCPP